MTLRIPLSSKFLPLVVGLLGMAASVQAQFVTYPAAPETVLDEVFKGKGVKVRNAKFVGSEFAMARFSNKAEQPGMASGLILSTGRAADATGPNENPKSSTALGTLGDRKLDAVANTRTFDAAILEFEFMAERDSITLNFVFASEEYAEHVGSTFTDPIAIAVTGPGYPQGRNLAVLPNSTTPININSINITENKRYYIDNNPYTLAGKPNPARKAELDADLLRTLQYDGMTKVMRVGLQVTPKEVYRMRIAIADAGDGNFDSAILIEAGSFQSLEQSRHLIARRAKEEKRIADSLAYATEMAERRADSLAAAERDRQEEMEGMAPEDAEAHGTPTETGEESLPAPGDDEEMEVALVRETPEETVEEMEETEETDPGEPDASQETYSTIVPFEEDSYFVPDEQEAILQEYGLILKAREDHVLGIFVPAAADAQTTDLRYDMIRLEVIKAGARPTQIFRMRFNLMPENPSMPRHRAELVLRKGE